MTSAATYGVVIAAHNEEKVLGGCLSSLLAGARPGELDIVVVANGCTDATASVAEAFAPAVRSVSTSVASKTAALNIGDQLVGGSTRFYLDADVLIDIAAVRTVAAALEDGTALAASPSLVMDTRGSSRLVRAYVRVWSALPSVRDDIAGRGIYALSAAGRARFDQFPDVIADDHYVRTVIPRHARVSVAGCSSEVKAPANLRAVIRRSIRVHGGNRQVDPDASAAPTGGWVEVLSRHPARILDLPVYVFVVGIAKLRSGWLRRTGRLPRWGQDDRSTPPVTA